MRYLILLLLFSSCIGSKSTQKLYENTQLTHKKEVLNNQKSTIEKTPGLSQSMSLALPDDIAQQVDDFSKTITSQNGKSRASVRKQGNTIFIENIIPGSSDTTTSSDTVIDEQKTLESLRDSYTKKVIKIVPWWLWLIAAIFLLPRIIESVTVIGNPLVKLLKTLLTIKS